MNWPIKLVFEGNPITKKNHRPIFKRRDTGKPFVGKSKSLADTEKRMIFYFHGARLRKNIPTLVEPLWITFLFFMKQKSTADLSNLYELPQDCLEKAKIISNDRIIESHDGSRKDLIDANNPRTVIFIRPYQRKQFFTFGKLN